VIRACRAPFRRERRGVPVREFVGVEVRTESQFACAGEGAPRLVEGERAVVAGDIAEERMKRRAQSTQASSVW